MSETIMHLSPKKIESLVEMINSKDPESQSTAFQLLENTVSFENILALAIIRKDTFDNAGSGEWESMAPDAHALYMRHFRPNQRPTWQSMYQLLAKENAPKVQFELYFRYYNAWFLMDLKTIGVPIESIETTLTFKDETD